MWRPAERAWIILLWLFILPPAWPQPTAAPPPDLSGLWSGWVVYKPAQTEVEVTAELARAADGAWTGTIDVPVQNIELMPLRRLVVDGSQISFDLVERSGTSAFSGQLSPDGRQIRGEVKEDGVGHAFVLERRPGRPAPPPAPVVRRLGDGGEELRALFDQESDKVRLVFLVSPTCPRCAIALRVLQHQLLDRVADPRLRVYVLWGPMLGDETEDAARRAARHLPDPRAVQFWTSTPTLATRVGQTVGLKDMPAWDVFLLFAPGARWTDPAPQPAYFMHQRGEQLPGDQALDAAKLSRRVRELLLPPASRGR